MEPGTLGDVYEGLPYVIDREKVLGEEGDLRDESETDCKESDEQLIREEVQIGNVYEFALEQQPNDVDKSETSDDQCAARNYAVARVVLPKLETANSIKLENKSEMLRELSEKSDFMAETNGSKAKHCSAEFDRILRRRAVVVLERCALLPSPTTPTQYFKIENETDDENSLGKATNSLQLENKSENLRVSEKRNFMFENFEIPNFTEFDRIFRRKSIVVLERCVLPSSSSDALVKDCVCEEGIRRETLEQHEKRIGGLNERFIEKETPEQYKECRADAAERQRKAIERETLEQREKRIVRLQNEKYKRFLAKETPEQCQKRFAVYNAYKRKWVKNRMLKQSEKCMAMEDSKNSFSAETKGEKQKTVIGIAEEDGVRNSDGAGECKQLAVTREREMCASQQHVNETGIKNEAVVEDEIEIIFDSYATNTKTKIVLESAKQHEKHLATTAQNYRRFMPEEMPEQHNQRLVASTETYIAARNKELREKRRAKIAEHNRKQREKETPEKRKKRLAYMAEYYKKKRKKRETSLQLEKRGLVDAERCETVEPAGINENGVLPQKSHNDINHLYQFCQQLQLHQPIWSKDVSGQALEAAQNGHLTDALAAQKFVDIPEATKIAAIKYNERRSNLFDCLFDRTAIPTVAASSPSLRMKNESMEERKKRLAVAERRRKARESETPEQRKKRLMRRVEYMRKWRKNKMLEQGENCLAAEDRLSSQVGNETNSSEQFSSKQTSEQMTAEISSDNYNARPSFLLDCLLVRQSISTTISSVGASSSAENGLSLQERNETPEERKKINLAKRVEYMRKQREKKKQEQFEKQRAAYIENERRWMEKEMHKQCQKCVTGINEDTLSPQNNNENNNGGTMNSEAINEDEVDFSSQDGNIIWIKSDDANEEHLSSEKVKGNNILKSDVVNENEKVNFSFQHFNEARKCEQVEAIGKREVCAQQVQCVMTNAETIREARVLETGEHDQQLVTQTENYEMFMVEGIPGQRNQWDQCMADSAEPFVEAREKETQEQRRKRYNEEYRRKQIENETPEQRKKRLARKAESKKKAKERETPEQREKRLEKQAEYTRRYLEKKTLKQGKEHLASALERWIKRMENETPELRKKYMTAMTERINQEVKEREMFQQLEKDRIAVAEIFKKMINVEPIDIHENGLSPPDDNENNNVSSYRIAADEVDFSSEHVIIENVMKSGAAVIDVIKDEVEIKFYESNVTDMKNKIKSEDQSEKNSEQVREKHLAAMGKHNEASERHKKYLAAIPERWRKAMDKETPEHRKERLAKQYEYTRKWLENRMLKRGKDYLAAITERWLKCMENETPEQREKYLADMTERIIQELKERDIFQQLEKEHIDVAVISKKVIKTEPIDGGRENGLSSQDDNENNKAGTMKSDPIDADGFDFSSQHVNEKAGKSEAVAVEYEEDELQIDFEAYFETGMNNSPIDENKLNFFFSI